MKRGLLALVVLAAATAIAAGTAVGGGNPDAAHACQQNGYLNLHRIDGSSFKNTGDCVSYFAHGGTAGCTVTATTGCLVFDNVVLTSYDGSGNTVTLNAAFSFNSTCNYPSSPCTSLPNNDATGGGTYVIDDASGNAVEQGTITTNDTPGTREGLDGVLTSYREAGGLTTTCGEAFSRQVAVSGSTGLSSDPWVELFAATPDNEVSFRTANSDQTGLSFDGYVDGSAITLTC